MLKIGITGGIGAGKSTIARIFIAMNFPVYFSDDEAKKLMNENVQIREGLIHLFGQNAYLPSGELNRELMSQKLFSDNEIRERVNNLVHPIVRLEFENWAVKQNSKMVFNEAAILFETGAHKNFDATILVTAPEDVKVKRVMQRNNSALEEVKNRMNKQWKDNEKSPLASFLILNDDKTPVLPQMERILASLNTI